MAKTSIEWSEFSWNPIRGCSRITPGCGGPNHQGGCYAEKIAARFSDPGQPFHGFAERTPHGGRWTGKLALVEDMLDLPLRWRKPRKIFVNSMSDLFHRALSDADIDRVFGVMNRCPQHIFQILTKRSDRLREYLEALPGRRDSWACDSGLDHGTWPLANVWIGVSVEDQERANERRDDLSAVAALGWTTWVSYEPALGPVDWSGWDFIKWLVAGGESGLRSRPPHPDWFRVARDWCAAHSIAFLFKQWGEWAPRSHLHPVDCFGKKTFRVDGESPNDCWGYFVGKKLAGRLLDGVTHDGYPAVQQ